MSHSLHYSFNKHSQLVTGLPCCADDISWFENVNAEPSHEHLDRILVDFVENFVLVLQVQY